MAKKGGKSVADWEAMFKAADKDGSGTLDVHELRDLLRQGNCNITDSQIADIFVYLDGPRGDRRITLQEFKKGMTDFFEFLDKLKAFFNEKDTDGSGALDRNEMTALLKSCGHNFTPSEISEIIRQADTSGDGQISFDELLNAMC